MHRSALEILELVEKSRTSSLAEQQSDDALERCLIALRYVTAPGTMSRALLVARLEKMLEDYPEVDDKG